MTPTTPVPGGTNLLVPTDPDHSILALRMNALDSNRMPRLGSRRLDPLGTGLMQAWITATTTCP